MSPERVGRDGLLHLRFKRRQDKTVLSQCRFRLPLQALAPTELADGTAYLMLLNPTGGLVGGDVLRTQIIQEDDTHLCLTTPSASRIYRTLGPPAVQETLIQVGERARLEYLPDHVIPHRDSSLRQTLHVEMERGSRAILWDALAAGRIAFGERWNFREFDSRIEISLSGETIFLNRTYIGPARLEPMKLGLAEDFTYLATFVIVAAEPDVCAAAVDAMNEELITLPRVYGGASLLARGGCIAKVMACSAADLIRMQLALWARARRVVFGLPAVDLRKY